MRAACGALAALALGLRGRGYFSGPDPGGGVAGEPVRTDGAWLLVLSMAGSFFFDVAYHFLVPGPDNVSTLPPSAWTLAFRVSAVLVVLASVFGFFVGVRALRELLPRRAGRWTTLRFAQGRG